MNDVANEKPMPASSDVARQRGGFDWSHALVELATVVIGILIALAVNNWAEARHNAVLEARYLERLLADSTENLTMLQERIDLLTRRTDQLTRLSGWLTGGTERPTDGEISEVLCRWFIQPALRLRRETYAELVSTGNLSLLRDVPLRGLLEQAETRHLELLRLDRFTDILQRETEPLNRYRQWEIDPNASLAVGCRFDLTGMRSDPVIPSILAQICRDETINRSFCEQELAAVRAVHDRIMKMQSPR
jgi:hypothetical protein